MMMRKIYLMLSILSAAFSGQLQAQNITGTWEGRMGHEMLYVNITQTNNKLCGYTYDHFIADKDQHCKAYFRGVYNSSTDRYMLRGVSFIENSGGHVLIQVQMWQEDDDDKDEMHALVGTASFLGSMFGGGGDPVSLRRISKKPMPLGNGKSTCYEPEKPQPKITPNFFPPKKADPVKPQQPADKAVVKKPTPVIPPVIKDSVITRKTDSVVKITKPVTPPDISIKKVNERKNKTIRTLTVNTRSIDLSVYDNGTIDGDTVSIFYNGKLIASRKRLTEKALNLSIELDPDATVHEITMFAENLGSIPPNTALIVVKAGGKRYELYSSASLTENAVLSIEYKPILQ